MLSRKLSGIQLAQLPASGNEYWPPKIRDSESKPFPNLTGLVVFLVEVIPDNLQHFYKHLQLTHITICVTDNYQGFSVLNLIDYLSLRSLFLDNISDEDLVFLWRSFPGEKKSLMQHEKYSYDEVYNVFDF